MSLITDISSQAAKAATQLALLDTATKNQVLAEMAQALRESKAFIIKENESDLAAARDNNLAASMIDRLTLNDERIEAMAEGIEVIVSLDDPVGQLREISERPNGIKISKMRVPLGVVCMIYEARPNVTADAGALCFKSGNGVILRGGKEALRSSQAIASVMHKVLEKHGLPAALISVIPDPDRGLLMELMQQRDTIDLIIPRGGEGLINFVTENSTIPVIQHFKGVCHLYVDKDADLNVAINLLLNGKTQRTGVCNALEGLVVHQDIADEFLNLCAVVLRQEGVKVNADAKAAEYFDNATVLADDEFGEEYLDLEIAIKVVPDFAGAIDHIAKFGSNHTEVICTKDQAAAELFQRSVDASVVMVNASSRFSDGSQLGLGAEIGIATTKLHAYGPMGLESLTTEKYLVNGEGQIRE
ncbi:glutamate-5-semialdehyde dehydrogenase [Pseudoalteromonas shioyasakiensis]|uniref:glutamate-5-semialdehyde dehydrogenase n=1 Tax=Pseudoalteromonas TaxID=53246 RepID=UPI0010210A68|nr:MULTISPECIES: glutamate-5-semialdehyde dehydrogenase [Pseudoalteromonas]MCG9708486.1 glutamate-5-semialdehyde dehydrogenase [Pseudoalteromonas sp. Isolate3]MCP4588733.1 glutamate-5-semialdehyde dehydrogenase [Pseudoalteromonas sp.]MCQ8883532.1 glutamate-5-semialdehyde dehydrogenase [Pseudoalteromonas shioyasakiensis]NIZ06095.1 glutamate-5-semialdehyde dehydrogenase [Pseudoalteromonas sp. HF66]QLE07617.1 glutamate-5-semialdehyde dehydrogenase [Pseudoalteromonas shioyasakiensis]|eukprot:gnl/Carplike_NY0171/1475_a2004_424.p1 GENE.gnl/Carplike_NY0171/1475_a2004_424~~gnl/Carplike_NY0171/1475_a2004_424.p1  ORF type:complete len:416 (-),score=74.18 gnl/Carplike_NY0171/1475_a2004_424:78-1325(-)